MGRMARGSSSLPGRTEKDHVLQAFREPAPFMWSVSRPLRATSFCYPAPAPGASFRSTSDIRGSDHKGLPPAGSGRFPQLCDAQETQLAARGGARISGDPKELTQRRDVTPIGWQVALRFGVDAPRSRQTPTNAELDFAAAQA